MNKKIDRTMFWFKDGSDNLLFFNELFFPLSILLNRCLNEFYNGKKVKFINIDFSTNKTYDLYPVLPKGSYYYYGGHLRCYGFFDIDIFNNLSYFEQKEFVWENGCNYLKHAAKAINNLVLFESVQLAYNKGISLNLIEDYKVVETDIKIHGVLVNASVWINFKKEGMFSKFVLKRNDFIIFEQDLDSTNNGIEFFLEIYKKIDFEGDNVVIRGHRDIDYLPLKIPINKFLF